MLAPIDFGPGNLGDFGPTPETNIKLIAIDIRDKKYRGRSTATWTCVDGRGAVGASQPTEVSANSSMPGSLTITNTAADLMAPVAKTPLLLSELVAKNTRQAVHDYHKTVLMHGDESGKAGCAANARLRDVLHYMVGHIDALSTLAWSVVQMYELDKLGIEQDDIVASVVAGWQHASNDEIWNVTPEQVVDIAVENGAQYVPLAGVHEERDVVMTLDETQAFNNRLFAVDHTHKTERGMVEDELFAASIGAYVHQTMAELTAAGTTPRDAALHVVRAIVYTFGLCKFIGNKDLQGYALGTPHPVSVAIQTA